MQLIVSCFCPEYSSQDPISQLYSYLLLHIWSLHPLILALTAWQGLQPELSELFSEFDPLHHRWLYLIRAVLLAGPFFRGWAEAPSQR